MDREINQMPSELSICPIDWKQYYDNVETALDIISTSKLDTDTKERLEELLRVDGISAYPEPYVASWEDTANNIDIICPPNASLPEVDWLRQQVDLLRTGRYRQ